MKITYKLKFFFLNKFICVNEKFNRLANGTSLGANSFKNDLLINGLLPCMYIILKKNLYNREKSKEILSKIFEASKIISITSNKNIKAFITCIMGILYKSSQGLFVKTGDL